MTLTIIPSNSHNLKQKYQLPLWIEIWLIISGIICAADVSFTMLRPLTNKEGSLEGIYFLCKFSWVEEEKRQPKILSN